MISGRTFSAVIPVYNMVDHLPALIDSLAACGLLATLDEVLIVDDGSTDGLSRGEIFQAAKWPTVRIMRLDSNRGRFIARWEGAKAARGDLLLFLDARVVLNSDFAKKLERSLQEHDFLQPQPRLDVRRNVFCLYWERSHQRIFRRHFRDVATGQVRLNPNNYDLYLKGTGALIVPRELFLRACEAMPPGEVLSDDTGLMRWMVARSSLWLTPDLWFWWTPRETLGQFLWRLYDRGPGMVEYHVFQRRGWIFWSIVGGLAGVGALGWMVAMQPELLIPVVVGAHAAAGLSVFLFARSVGEALRMMGLHVLVLWAVGLGILRGLAVNIWRWIKGELRWQFASDRR